MEENNRLKNESLNHKKILLSIIGLFILIGITFGVTYAFFNYTKTGEENTIGTGILEFDYQDGQQLQLSNQFT